MCALLFWSNSFDSYKCTGLQRIKITELLNNINTYLRYIYIYTPNNDDNQENI